MERQYHLEDEHLVRDCKEAEWTSRVNMRERNSRERKESSPRNATGNAFTPKELLLATMATLRILSAACMRALGSVHAFVCVCQRGHTHTNACTHCIGQQLVTLLQI